MLQQDLLPTLAGHLYSYTVSVQLASLRALAAIAKYRPFPLLRILINIENISMQLQQLQVLERVEYFRNVADIDVANSAISVLDNINFRNSGTYC